MVYINNSPRYNLGFSLFVECREGSPCRRLSNNIMGNRGLSSHHNGRFLKAHTGSDLFRDSKQGPQNYCDPFIISCGVEPQSFRWVRGGCQKIYVI